MIWTNADAFTLNQSKISESTLFLTLVTPDDHKYGLLSTHTHMSYVISTHVFQHDRKESRQTVLRRLTIRWELIKIFRSFREFIENATRCVLSTIKIFGPSIYSFRVFFLLHRRRRPFQRIPNFKAKLVLLQSYQQQSHRHQLNVDLKKSRSTANLFVMQHDSVANSAIAITVFQFILFKISNYFIKPGCTFFCTIAFFDWSDIFRAANCFAN